MQAIVWIKNTIGNNKVFDGIFCTYSHGRSYAAFAYDFVPFTADSKRGLEIRISLKKAFEMQGFVCRCRSDTELNRLVYSEKEVLAKIMLEHGIEWDQKRRYEKHKSIGEFKSDKLV